jgi:hypothetical protein
VALRTCCLRHYMLVVYGSSTSRSVGNMCTQQEHAVCTAFRKNCGGVLVVEAHFGQIRANLNF